MSGMAPKHIRERGGIEADIEGAEYFEGRQLEGGVAGWLLLAGLGVAYVISGDFAGRVFGLGQVGWGGVLLATAVVAPVVFLGAAIPKFDASNLTDNPTTGAFRASASLPFGVVGIWAALSNAIWFLLAAPAAPLAAEESKNPVKDIPRGIVVTTGIACALAVVALIAGFHVDTRVVAITAAIYVVAIAHVGFYSRRHIVASAPEEEFALSEFFESELH